MEATPHAVADRLFAALAHSDWPAAVAACEADQLTGLRDRGLAVLAISRHFAEAPPSGSGGAVLDAATIASAVAQVGHTPIYGFPDAHTLAEAAALSAPVFASNYLAALDDVYAELSVPRRIVGVVEEGETLAHVLYRRDDSARRKQGRLRRGNAPPPSWTVSVLTLGRRDGEWRAMLNGEIAAERLDFIQAYLAPESPGDQAADG